MATHRYYQANAARRRELQASAGNRVVGAEAPWGLGQEPAPLGLLPDLSAAQLDDLGLIYGGNRGFANDISNDDPVRPCSVTHSRRLAEDVPWSPE